MATCRFTGCGAGRGNGGIFSNGMPRRGKVFRPRFVAARAGKGLCALFRAGRGFRDYYSNNWKSPSFSLHSVF